MTWSAFALRPAPPRWRPRRQHGPRAEASPPPSPAEPAASSPAITAPPPASGAELGARELATPPSAPSLCAEAPRHRGIVQWFGDRGYGFVRGEDGRDVFVHRSAIGRGMFPRLIEGQFVEYEVQQTSKGPQAVAVTPLQGRAQRGW